MSNKIIFIQLLISFHLILAKDSNIDQCNDLNEQEYSCPQSSGRFAHETDCRKFWECSHFVPRLKCCPEGLYWNDNKKECDWKCSSTEKQTTTQTIETTTKPLTSAETTEETTNLIEETTSSNDDFTCPERAGLYAHKKSCAKFWMCSNWIRFEKSCAEGTHWNDNIKTCDWPANVNCKIAETTTTKIDTTSFKLGFICPERYGLYSHTESCDKYWECSNWTPHEKSCAEGTHWNDNIKTCDWPVFANCTINV